MQIYERITLSCNEDCMVHESRAFSYGKIGQLSNWTIGQMPFREQYYRQGRKKDHSFAAMCGKSGASLLCVIVWTYFFTRRTIQTRSDAPMMAVIVSPIQLPLVRNEELGLLPSIS